MSDPIAKEEPSPLISTDNLQHQRNKSTFQIREIIKERMYLLFTYQVKLIEFTAYQVNMSWNPSRIDRIPGVHSNAKLGAYCKYSTII